MSPPWQDPKGVLWNIFSSSRMQRPHVGSKIWLIYGDISLNRETQTRATLEKKKRVAKNNFYSEKKKQIYLKKRSGHGHSSSRNSSFYCFSFWKFHDQQNPMVKQFQGNLNRKETTNDSPCCPDHRWNNFAPLFSLFDHSEGGMERQHKADTKNVQFPDDDIRKWRTEFGCFNRFFWTQSTSLAIKNHFGYLYYFVNSIKGEKIHLSVKDRRTH